MTFTDRGLAEADVDGVSRVADVDGIPMSGLLREVPEPRAVIVALHGGAASSRYFHYPAPPRLSLLETGAALGFTVLALDRPGYGRSAPYAGTMTSAGRRVDLAYAAVDGLLGSRPRGAGLFLIAHSAGCELAVRMAADARGRDLLGLELAGTGRHFHPTAEKILKAVRQDASRPRRPTGLQAILWEPTSLYPPGVVGGAHFVSPSPGYEGEVVREWAPRDFARTAPEVRVPVQYTLGDHDLVWRNDRAAMADIAGLFTAAPRVVTNEQADSGHNLSLGLTAMAYHLKVLSFVEECVQYRAGR
jgi:pimeloyl-ACP methyl ester carboxylesterase